MKTTCKMIAALLLAVSFPPPASPALPSGKIQGRVCAARSRAPLTEVLIVIAPARPDVTSGTNGVFSIPSLPGGRYTLEFHRAGFISREIPVDLKPGETTEIEVLLEPTRLTLHEEITVTAERDPKTSFESPFAIRILTARKISEQWPRTSPEALPEAAGVWLQKTNHGGGSPFLRGLTGNQVLALVDGIRLNNSTCRYGPNQYINGIDPYSTDRIEILPGAGSTLYGSDAVGGVLNFLTPSPGLAAHGTEISAAGRAKLVSGDMETSGRLDVRLRTPRLGIAGGSSIKKRGLYPDRARAINLAAYHAQSIDIARFGLRAGFRCNLVRIRTRDDLFGDTCISPAAAVGHFSLLYRLSDSLHALFNLSRSFRAPNINDLSSFGAFDYGIEVPAPDLKPEYGTTLEAGVKSRGSRWAWGFYLYRTWLQDLIVRIESTYLGSAYYGDDRVYCRANRHRAYIQGFESEAQGEIGRRWRIVMNATYTFGHNIDDDEPLRRIPPLFGRARLEYYPGLGFQAAVECLFAAKQDRLSSGDIADHRIPAGGTPGWQVVNIQAQWRRGGFQLTAGLQNLFDSAYRTHGSGIDAAGRCAWSGVRWGWLSRPAERLPCPTRARRDSFRE